MHPGLQHRQLLRIDVQREADALLSLRTAGRLRALSVGCLHASCATHLPRSCHPYLLHPHPVPSETLRAEQGFSMFRKRTGMDCNKCMAKVHKLEAVSVSCRCELHNFTNHVPLVFLSQPQSLTLSGFGP